MSITARLERLSRSLQEGFARAGGCSVCQGWPAWRDGSAKDDPWAPFEACPVCGRRPTMVFARTPEEAERLAAACGPGAKTYIGVSIHEL